MEPLAAGRSASTSLMRGPAGQAAAAADSWSVWGTKLVTTGLMLAQAQQQQQQQQGEALAAAMVRAADSALRSKSDWQRYSPLAVRQAHEGGVLGGLLQLLQATTITRLPDAAAEACALLASVSKNMGGDGADEVRSAVLLPLATSALALLGCHGAQHCSHCTAPHRPPQRQQRQPRGRAAAAGWWCGAAFL